jgi:hypothetical protein
MAVPAILKQVYEEGWRSGHQESARALLMARFGPPPGRPPDAPDVRLFELADWLATRDATTVAAVVVGAATLNDVFAAVTGAGAPGRAPPPADVDVEADIDVQLEAEPGAAEPDLRAVLTWLATDPPPGDARPGAGDERLDRSLLARIWRSGRRRGWHEAAAALLRARFGDHPGVAVAADRLSWQGPAVFVPAALAAGQPNGL